MTLTDLVLNIDPTDEDVWTFGTRSTNSSTFYNLFDEHGTKANTTDRDLHDTQAINIQSDLGTIGLGTAILLLNNDTQSVGTYVTELKDNGNNIMTQEVGQTTDTGLRTSVMKHESLPITFTETGSNTGVFVNFDEGDSANLKVCLLYTSPSPRD